MSFIGAVGKFAFGVAKIAVNAVIDTACEANEIRNSSGNMSNRDLINGIKDKNSTLAQKTGYYTALKDRANKK